MLIPPFSSRHFAVEAGVFPDEDDREIQLVCSALLDSLF